VAIGRIIDVSSNQHPNGAPINWTAVAADGVTTAIVKATQGTTYINPYYANDAHGAAAAGLEVLAYHFATFTDPAAEAAHFRAVAGPLAAVGDFETSENVAWMRAFLEDLELPMTQLLAYGSASTLRDVYSQLPAMAWPAAYGQLYPGWGVMWQFTDKATVAGIPGGVDESSWHGSEMQYEILFHLTDPPPDPYSGGLMFDGLAASKQDNFNATLRYLWGQIRTDAVTAADFSNFWYAYNLPVAEKGYGGSMDLVVANVIDQGRAAGTLRATWQGAV
jgi:lysozyme